MIPEDEARALIEAELAKAGESGLSAAELVVATDHSFSAVDAQAMALAIGAKAQKVWTGWGLTKERATIKYVLEAPTVYSKVEEVYLLRSEDDNFDDLVEQTARISRGDYVTTKDDHKAAMELLWNHLDQRGVLARKYEEHRHVRDESSLGIFVKVYESTTGLAG
ncbi:hypothetical protein ACH4YO_08205 [Streptomyces noursei]|uniref:hypothetical protein n=1 Tax=Streptomyces noursei TaxID=1971 RepID=UPI003411D8E9